MTGAEALQKSGLSLNVSVGGAFGMAVCTIDGEGCESPQEDCFCKSYGSPSCTGIISCAARTARGAHRQPRRGEPHPPRWRCGWLVVDERRQRSPARDTGADRGGGAIAQCHPDACPRAHYRQRPMRRPPRRRWSHPSRSVDRRQRNRAPPPSRRTGARHRSRLRHNLPARRTAGRLAVSSPSRR